VSENLTRNLPNSFEERVLAELAAIRQENAQTNVHLTSLEGRMTSFEDRMISLEGRMASFEDRMTSLEGRMTSLEDRMTSLEDRMTSIEDRMTSIEDRVTSIEGRVTSIEDRVTSIESRMISLQDRTLSIDVRLTSLEEKVDARLGETRPIWESVQLRLSGVEAELNNLNRQIRTLLADIFQMRVRVEKLEDNQQAL
jgi:chromosome segregation ATPase